MTIVDKTERMLGRTLSYGKMTVRSVVSLPKRVWDEGIVRGILDTLWDLNDETVALRKDILGELGLR